MSGVRVLVGTRKGAFVLTSDGNEQYAEPVKLHRKNVDSSLGCISASTDTLCQTPFNTF